MTQSSVEKKLIVGLEIGTSKIVVMVGEISSTDNVVNIIGIGRTSSRGINNKGIVNNLELFIKSIELAIEEAELMSNCHISSVYLGLSGKYISCINETGMLSISNKSITQEDIFNVVQIAQSVRLRNEEKILHVIPQEYIVDYQDGIKNPLGLSGMRMQAKVHLIICNNDMIQNILKAIEYCKIKIDQLIFSGLASTYSVIDDNDRESGVCVIDIGAGTMDIIIYSSGILRLTKVIPYAGNIVTQDISYAFGILYNEAEIIKIKYGSAWSFNIPKNEILEISGSGDNLSRTLQRKILAEVIELRYTELINLINTEILQLQSNMREKGVVCNLNSGIVFTGGGSKINGLLHCAENIFKMKVRIAKPINVTGLIDYAQDSYYSTIIGLLYYGKELYFSNNINIDNTSLNSWYKKFINWIKKEF